jgi:hypothetical protein
MEDLTMSGDDENDHVTLARTRKCDAMSPTRRLLAAFFLLASLASFVVGETWLNRSMEDGYSLAHAYKEVLDSPERTSLRHSALESIKIIEDKRIPWEWPFGFGYTFVVLAFLMILGPQWTKKANAPSARAFQMGPTVPQE